MLDGYRILDLTDDRGDMAGFLLALLGAEVIAVEPPQGQRSRHHGPWAGDIEDPERSLTHWAYNRGKTSVTASSQADVEQLAVGADMVIDCGALNIDLERLRKTDPALVTVSISAFGTDGPKADWAATDLTVAASGGAMSLAGDADRAPVRMTLPQVWRQGALNAACGAMIAMHERNRSGLGQHVDVSCQQAMIPTAQFQMMCALVGQESPQRLPGGFQMGPFTIRNLHACLDGHVTVLAIYGPMIGPFTSRLFNWIHEEGFCGEDLRDKNWIDFGMNVFDGTEPASEMDRSTEAIARFIATKTKEELLTAAMDKKLLIGPVATTDDVMAQDQLASRSYWDDVDTGLPDVGIIQFPGMFTHTNGPEQPILGPAPRLGSGTVTPRPANPVPANPEAPQSLALAGLKVCDLMWALAGPGATRILADHGATVVRIESSTRPDTIRAGGPFLSEEGDPEHSLQWHSPNAGKLDLSLNIQTTEGRQVLLDLVRWSDVVTESFSPETMTRSGLGYEDLREIRPDIIMISSCLMGQSGPLSSYTGFGTMAAAMAGFYSVTGWPDRMPAGVFGAYTDYVAHQLTATVVLAALEHRRKTGEGMYIDFSQFEGSLHMLTPALLDEATNARTINRQGNDDPLMAPHGVYPAAGDDRWIAIACEDEEQWKSLARLIGADDRASMSLSDRQAANGQLDELIANWTSSLDPETAQAQLQQMGVPAHMVQTSATCVSDPQLIHRGQFLELPHEQHGTSWAEGLPFHLSRTPGLPKWAGPTLGQHTNEVLTDLLGYDADQIAELVIAGALE